MLEEVPGYHGNISRYGHTAVSISDQAMLVFGGFKGQTYHELLQFNKGNCNQLKTRERCLTSLCAWSGIYCTDITLNKTRFSELIFS